MNDETPRLVNKSGVHHHALKVSTEKRAGKFTRVSQEFIDEVTEDLEALIREIRNKYPIDPKDQVEITPTLTRFVSDEFMHKLGLELHAMVGRMIQKKVMRLPSVGVTVTATR